MWARIGWMLCWLCLNCSIARIYAAPLVPTTSIDLKAQEVISLTDWLLTLEPIGTNPSESPTAPQLLQSSASQPIFRIEQVLELPLQSTIRASCQIEVSQPTKAVLIYGISGSATLRLNGKVLLTHSRQPSGAAISFTDETEQLEFTPVELPAGKSLLTLEFPPGSKAPIGFTVRLATQQAAQQYFAKTEPYSGAEIFLNQRIYPQGSNLQLYPELQATLNALKISSTLQMSDPAGKVIYDKPVSTSGEWTMPSDHLPAGLYNATLIASPFVLHQQLLMGDPSGYFGEVNRQANTLKPKLTDERLRLDLAALEFRFSHLNSAAHYLPTDNEWQRKIVFTLDEYQQMVTTCLRNPEDERRRPGLHYRSFRSAIDGQVQYYMLYYPNTGNKPKPIPLVVVVPYETAPLRPFLESIHVAKIGYLKAVTRTADKYGYAVLMPDARGNVGISPIEEADLFESLNDVEHDIPINTKSIYLMGFSYGAARALMLGIHHPDMFAAIAGVGPTLNVVHRESSSVDMAQLMAAKSWLRLNGVGAGIASLSNTPLYFMHGDKDRELPAEIMQRFVDYCQHKGVKATLDIVPGMNHVNYPVFPFPKVFDFFQGKTLPDSPHQVQLETGDLNYASSYWVRILRSTARLKTTQISATYDDKCQVHVQSDNVADFDLKLSDLKCENSDAAVTIGNQQPIMVPRRQKSDAVFHFNGATSNWSLTSNPESMSKPGPLYHVFGGPFKIIAPASDTGAGENAATKSVTTFCQGWTQLFFVPCPKTSPLTTKELSGDQNLIFVGQASNVPYVQEILKQAQVVTGKDFLQIGGKRFEGIDLSYLLLAPEKAGQSRTTLIVGGTESTNCYFMPASLVRTGWYDVAVWNCADVQSPQLFNAAYFDNGSLKWTSDLPQ